VQTVDLKLEVVILPVSDVDRAKQFYKGLGWREDADIVGGENFRIVQLTPPGSACSISFGTGVTTMTPGSQRGLLLVVDDIAAARAELVEHGASVSEVFHGPAGRFHPDDPSVRLPGPDPDGRSYQSHAVFSDPDGNGWVLQEITKRLQGR
jgi:catechol 2,3-dioxygenase-like lactoylglutathione lyase family enzyme